MCFGDSIIDYISRFFVRNSLVFTATLTYNKQKLYIALRPLYRRIIDMFKLKAHRLCEQHGAKQYFLMYGLIADDSVFAYLAFSGFNLRLYKHNCPSAILKAGIYGRQYKPY